MNASDNELLELAAKAHGNLKFIPHCGWIHEAPDGSRGNWWSPLNNDGDALRLAVKLELDVMPSGAWSGAKNNELSAFVQSGHGLEVVVEHHGDPYAATRRAIVRAAAEIGKGGDK